MKVLRTAAKVDSRLSTPQLLNNLINNKVKLWRKKTEIM